MHHVQPSSTVGSSPGPDAMRRAFATLPQGVCLLQAAVDGKQATMTVSSATPLSLTPPLLLTCIRKQSFIGRNLVRIGEFHLAVLARSQVALSEQFGRPASASNSSPDPSIAFSAARPLHEAVLTLSCRQHIVYDGGDHWILVGDVTELAAGEPQRAPLIHYRRTYWFTVQLELPRSM